MCKAALPRPLASAFVVLAGPHGDISKHAQQRGVCRQRLYRETAMVLAAVDGEAAGRFDYSIRVMPRSCMAFEKQLLIVRIALGKLGASTALKTVITEFRNAAMI